MLTSLLSICAVGVKRKGNGSAAASTYVGRTRHARAKHFLSQYLCACEAGVAGALFQWRCREADGNFSRCQHVGDGIFHPRNNNRPENTPRSETFQRPLAFWLPPLPLRFSFLRWAMLAIAKAAWTISQQNNNTPARNACCRHTRGCGRSRAQTANTVRTASYCPFVLLGMAAALPGHPYPCRQWLQLPGCSLAGASPAALRLSDPPWLSRLTGFKLAVQASSGHSKKESL